MKKPQPFRIRRGNTEFRVAPHRKGWRFSYRDGGRWRYVTRRLKADIIEAAECLLDDMDTGFLYSTLPRHAQTFLAEVHRLTPEPADRQAVLEMLRSREDTRNSKLSLESFSVQRHGLQLPITRDENGWRLSDPVTRTVIYRTHRADIIRAAEAVLGQMDEECRRMAKTIAGDLLAKVEELRRNQTRPTSE